MKQQGGRKILPLGLMVCLAAIRAGAQQKPNPTAVADPTVAVWARDAVASSGQDRILADLGSGAFHGVQSVTRYQAAYALIRLLLRFNWPRTAAHPDRATEFLLAQFSPTVLPAQSKEEWDYLKEVAPICFGPGYLLPSFHEWGFVRGYPSGYFQGKRPLSRAQLAVLLCRFLRCAQHAPALNLGRANFRDVAGDEWWFGAALTAAGSGLMSGFPDHTFRPDQAVTRNEFAAALARLARLADPSLH